ncbi:MAG: recombination mediator RecR [bacterium]
MSSPLDRLIQDLSRLPGIGEKTATRLAFFILRSPKAYAEGLSQTLREVVNEIRFCSTCQNFTQADPCKICADPARDRSILLVVEGPQEMRSIEQGRSFKGLYHILHGALSPLDRVGPEDLKIKELLIRLSEGPIREVILATNTHVEGEATALYLIKLIKPLGIRLSRIASGIPVGGDLEYVDSMTLQRAIEGRREV